MTEADMTDITGERGRHLATLASVPLPELVTAARVQMAAMGANLAGDDDEGDDREDAITHGCAMDAGLVAYITDRPAETLADLAAKAALAAERLAPGHGLTAEERALVLGVLAEVGRFAECVA